MNGLNAGLFLAPGKAAVVRAEYKPNRVITLACSYQGNDNAILTIFRECLSLCVTSTPVQSINPIMNVEESHG
jgi:hypothetical protein